MILLMPPLLLPGFLTILLSVLPHHRGKLRATPAVEVAVFGMSSPRRPAACSMAPPRTPRATTWHTFPKIWTSFRGLAWMPTVFLFPGLVFSTKEKGQCRRRVWTPTTALWMEFWHAVSPRLPPCTTGIYLRLCRSVAVG